MNKQEIKQHIHRPESSLSSSSLRLFLSSSSFCVTGHAANGLISRMKCTAEEMSGSMAAVWLPGREVKGRRQVYWTFSLSPFI